MENKTKHTPGPWTYHKGETGYFPTVTIPWEHPELYPGVEDHIAINAGNGPHERHEANAALIAAAPDMAARIKELERLNKDMLAALENLLAEFVHVPGDTEGNKDRTTAARIIGGPNAALARAREAIEKAKGISTSAAESPTWEDKVAAAIAAIVYADTPEERDAAIKKAEGLVD